MIEQIYIGNRLEIVYSIEEACNLVRDEFSEDLGKLLWKTIDDAFAECENQIDEANDARDRCDDLEDECAEKESELESVRDAIRHIIDFELDDIDMKDSDFQKLVELLETAIQ